MERRGRRILLSLVVAAFMVWGVSGCRHAGEQQSASVKFPEKTVTLFTTSKPGAAMDMQVRLLAPYVQKQLGVPVVVESKTGAGGRVARVYLSQAKPDGYSLLMTGWPSLQLGELVYDPGYKTTEFTYVYNLTGADYGVLFVATDSPYQTFEQLLEAARTKEIVVAGSSLGAGDHMCSVMLRKIASLQHKYVPFGSGETTAAVLGKHADAGIDSISGIAGRTDIRILVVFSGSSEPVGTAPGVPTMGMLGFKSFEVVFRCGIIGPPGMPEDRRAVLESAFAKAVADSEFLEAAQKAQLALEPMDGATFRDKSVQLYNDLQDIAAVMKEDVAKGGGGQ